MEVQSSSPIETQKIAINFSKKILPGDTVAIYGNLGVGKTIFVQGLAKGLGIKRKILSPTFVFMRSYEFAKKGKKYDFHHIDLYRGESESDFRAIGLEDIFSQRSVVVLEWAEKISNILPKKKYEVRITTLGENIRKINIKKRC